jgi:predicted PurR-regulated permease PerM
MDNLANLPPAVTLVLAVLVAVWLVLLLFVPFMIASIRNSTRRANMQLEQLNQRIDRLIALSERRDAPVGPSSEPRSPLGERVRREPTISG